MSLAGSDGQALVHRRAKRDLVQEAAVDARNRDDPAGAASHDGGAQGVWPVRAQERRCLDLVDDGVEGGSGVGFGSNGIDAFVRAVTARHLLDAVGNGRVLVVEIDDLRAGLLRQR
ncbi:hypothetical protein D3C72_2028480 [compost metagenome]